MPALIWDEIGKRTYELGCDRGVLYPQSEGQYTKGVAWSGLTNITETPSGAEDNSFYADNIKYLSIKGAEEFGLTVECYTYPDEWKECNGEKEIATGVNVGQQARNTFGLCYRTVKGNDTQGTEHGYKLHLAYGCSASPSERAFASINDSPEPNNFSYEISTTPVPVGEGYKPTSLITIDSTKVDAEKLKALEDILYARTEGENVVARLPMPSEVMTMFAAG